MKIRDFIPSIFNFDKPQPKAANVRNTIKIGQQLTRIKQDGQKFRLAVQSAESVMYPNRYLLTQLYQEVVLDAQVQSAMLQRNMPILRQKFHVLNASGEPDEEKTKLFKAQWFYNVLKLAMEKNAHGFSLIQFYPIVDDKFNEISLVPRQYVVPELDLVKTTTANLIQGVNFTEKPYSNWCIGVGDKRDLGFLMKCAPYVISKRNGLIAWNEFAEVFGSPIRIGKTTVRDEATRKNMIDMLANMGTSTYAVIDTDDEIELVEAGRTDSYQVYDRLIERCNGEISKIILGQTGTTDEKSYVGSAEVHEGVAHQIAQQDLLEMQFMVNDRLIPMMINLGFALDGYTFEFDMSEQMDLKEQAIIDASFMPYAQYNKEYLEKKYSIELEEKVEEESVAGVQKKLNNLYK